MRRSLAFTCCMLPGFLLAPLGRAEEPGRTVFREQVRDLLTNKCLACHSADKPKGDLDLTRRESALDGGANGPALKPGSAAESLLYQRVLAHKMPPKNPLS